MQVYERLQNDVVGQMQHVRGIYLLNPTLAVSDGVRLGSSLSLLHVVHSVTDGVRALPRPIHESLLFHIKCEH